MFRFRVWSLVPSCRSSRNPVVLDNQMARNMKKEMEAERIEVAGMFTGRPTSTNASSIVVVRAGFRAVSW